LGGESVNVTHAGNYDRGILAVLTEAVKDALSQRLDVNCNAVTAAVAVAVGCFGHAAGPRAVGTGAVTAVVTLLLL